MKKSAEFLSDLASQVESGLITLDEAFDVVAGNEKLSDEEQRLVNQCVLDCRSSGAMKRLAGPDNGEAYAYRHPNGGIAWGYNGGEHGFCVARGIRD